MMRQMRSDWVRLRLLWSLALTMLAVGSVGGLAQAEDWPHWNGPNRDGHSAETGLLKSWPAGGPKEVWSASNIGIGFASMSVVNGVVYTTGVKDGKGVLVALSEKDGAKKWRSEYGKGWTGSYKGARSTPTVSDGLVYVMSGYGVVSCFDAKSGKKKWSKDVLKKYGGRNISWGISESLLVDGKMLICTPGGSGASVVALNKKSGKEIWKSSGLSQLSAYCSPRIIKRGKKRIIVTMLKDGVVGLSLKGKKLWFQPHKTSYDVHANTPVYDEENGILYYTSGYGAGGGALQLSSNGSKATKKWFFKKLDCHHGGVVLVDGYIYGTNAKGAWICLDIKTGAEKYNTSSPVGKGSVIYADGMLYGYGERGTMGLIKATPKGHDVVSSFRVTKGGGQHWAHPVIANGKLFIRHGDIVMAYAIKK